MLKYIILFLTLTACFTHGLSPSEQKDSKVSAMPLKKYTSSDIQNLVSLAESLNNCIQFSVASGTGCEWMCSYCANTLGTYNYYFTDSVCTYQTGGCVGNPIAGKTYTCCSL